MGVSIPKSTTNNLELQDQRRQIGVNTFLGLLNSGITMVSGGAGVNAAKAMEKPNPMGELIGYTNVAQGAASAVSTVLNTWSQLQALHEYNQCIVPSGDTGNSTPQTVKVRVTYPIVAGTEISDYGRLIGFPYSKFRQLKDLTGFTVVGACHIENIPRATDTELDDIQTQLKTGIIL